MNVIKPVTSDDMLLEQVAQARRMTPEQKIRAGGQLFDGPGRLEGVLASLPKRKQ